MACDIKIGWAFVNILMLISTMQQCVLGLSQVPCFFIFGDSLSDSGNNNLLATLTKANYLPYGNDFAIGPTGRFCNGETRVDVIDKFLGFVNYIPPFAMATSYTLRVLNYAFSGSGILDHTGGNLGEHISLNQQLQNHKVTIKSIVAKLGTIDSATQYLNQCLYTVGMGTNDYANNYFSTLFSLKSLLFLNFSQFCNSLCLFLCLCYNELDFARSWSEEDCTPYTINVFPVNITGCVENLNHAAKLFNKKLKSLVDQLNTNLSDAKFIYVNKMHYVQVLKC
ncbi:hypothetical protein Patl1_10328 [Pistacia atlantica]|uniref:Uncharacterized protein n=1 Tax=Pistacia atlantica TaxID=434234 RepID=A0ACC1A5D1_9ROSI|nr:hypothetical protein Patl1_10328 [Pistacia atlantica]